MPRPSTNTALPQLDPPTVYTIHKRFNRTIIEVLRHYEGVHPNDWDLLGPIPSGGHPHSREIFL